MNWTQFNTLAFSILSLWGLTIIFLLLPRKKLIKVLTHLFTIAGIGLLLYFIIFLWIRLARPPMRTLGETRLWYSFFLPIIGYIIFLRWKYRWFLAYTLGMAALFLYINIIHPENHDKTLMPALQSIWFIPHVIVYMVAYALLAGATLVSVKGLWTIYINQFKKDILLLADNMVYVGFALLTMGLIFGALWAKKAWGHYWTWDPKETWAFITWMGYLVYMHFRFHKPKLVKLPLWILALSFVILLICWFGVNYLPSAQQSVHTYSN